MYFVNKVEQMAIAWGTDSKIQYIEPTYGFPLAIGASGEMSLRVNDSKRLLVNLVGTERDLSQNKLISYFRAFLMARVKTYIAQTMKKNEINIFEIDEHLLEFSNTLKQLLIPDFDEYGIALERFFVTTVVKPDGSLQYEKYKDLHFRQYADIADAKIRQQVSVIDQQTEAQKRLIDAQSMAQKRKIEGYTYQQERGFDVAEKAAQNEGAGNFSSAGIGLGVMAGISGTIGNTISGAINNTVGSVNTITSSNMYCDNCGAKLSPDSLYCEECGTPVQKRAFCNNCGYIFERPGKFCPKCGTKREN